MQLTDFTRQIWSFANLHPDSMVFAERMELPYTLTEGIEAIQAELLAIKTE